jgi:hypothetical protein
MDNISIFMCKKIDGEEENLQGWKKRENNFMYDKKSKYCIHRIYFIRKLSITELTNYISISNTQKLGYHFPVFL